MANLFGFSATATATTTTDSGSSARPFFGQSSASEPVSLFSSHDSTMNKDSRPSSALSFGSGFGSQPDSRPSSAFVFGSGFGSQPDSIPSLAFGFGSGFAALSDSRPSTGFTLGHNAPTPGTNAPVSLQAPASHFEFKSSTSTFSSSVAFSTTPSSIGSLANVEAGPASNSSSLEDLSLETKSDPEKENMSSTGIRESNQVPVPNSPLTLTVVSRILNGIPQHPHFYQLRNCSELTRNNLVTAWDQSFEETVKEIHSLQNVDHFWVRAKELWKTLEELQNVGYNVIPLRKRLVELTDVVMELESRKAEIKGLKIKAENHRMEKCRLESVILNLQAMAKREEDKMESLLVEAANLEDDFPKFGGIFS